MVCFDKTGTLTEDGLDVLGVRLARNPELRYVTRRHMLRILAYRFVL